MPNDPKQVGGEGTQQGTQQPAGTETQATAPASAPVGTPAPEPPKAVPIERFQQVYGESQEERRRRLAVEAENKQLREQLARSQQTAPQQQQQRQQDPQLEADRKFVQDAVQPVVAPVLETVARIAAREQVREVRDQLDGFWRANPDYASYRDRVDQEILKAIAQGAKPEEIAGPDVLLNHFIGLDQRTKAAASREASRTTTQQVVEANKNAAAETRHTAVPEPTKGTNKKFSEMTAAEIESQYGKEVIWEKGLRRELE